MLVHVHPDQSPTAVLREPSPALGKRLTDWLMRFLAEEKPGWLRFALAAAAFFGVAAFVLGAGNRLTRGPWFLYPPGVSLVPPIGSDAWKQAFVLHQQSPVYALCGGYDVGGMESIVIFRFLYWWEWSRIASIVLLAISLFVAVNLYLRGAVKYARRFDLLPWIGLVAAILAYFVLGYFADHAGQFATINLGQHRHALDITFASVGLGMLIAVAMAPARPQAGSSIPRIAWGSVIALNIAFGALIEALDAGPLWTSFPGYTDSLLPTADRLFALHPVWRNFTENGYLIQACHRILSIGLWAAALLGVATAMLKRLPWTRALVLFGLLTLDGALGIATLRTGQPVIVSILHQVCAIAVLAAALVAQSQGGADRRLRVYKLTA
jgi:cytochrome c oxidase assembly protein subunit 15